MSTPLLTAINTHLQKGRSSFHTPGHKGRPQLSTFNFQLSTDITELPDTDSLFEAGGAIAEAERLAAQSYGAYRTLFSAGGCTLCIQAMLRLACKAGDTVIMGRNAHKSAVNTAALLDLQPVWLYPNSSLLYAPEAVEQAILKHPEAAAVYLTTPDYHGRISPINKISQLCRKHGIPLLVDRAHGSHLPFISGAAELISGADMYADSLHKTLPVLTSGAVLNIYNQSFAPLAKSAMSLFASTSPSYLVLCSLDSAREWLDTHGKEELERTALRVAKIRNLAAQLGMPPLNVPTDPCRLCLNTEPIGLSGHAAAEYLRSQGIEPELSDAQSVVLICTPFNTEADFIRLESALRGIKAANPIKNSAIYAWEAHTAHMSVREAALALHQRISIHKAAGRICGETVSTCPPGIPILMPGEKILENDIIFCAACGILEINVVK
ncbi:MAG: aminotransferase class V-fold PLP-dependent enzyme [Oscillospiraceae bacterium]|jgi:arginine/lysine/ornithine decarboxylase|nr:aminotransferase class V-fold PLP-dependent enzyme [Oscillospiraceae bacterium]